MRLRNVKNKELILENAHSLVKDPFTFKGRWKDYFHNDYPIYIEIGMGKGKFIYENAKMNPNINYIGIEKYDSVIVKAIQRVDEILPNLVFVRMDALEIEKVFDKEIKCIFLNFSDPWPKKRHHLRRLSSPVFLDKYHKILLNDSCIEMRTDNRDLFQYSLVSFSNNRFLLEEVSLDFHQDTMPLITTEYEDRFSNEGMPIYYVKVKRDCQ